MLGRLQTVDSWLCSPCPGHILVEFQQYGGGILRLTLVSRACCALSIPGGEVVFRRQPRTPKFRKGQIAYLVMFRRCVFCVDEGSKLSSGASMNLDVYRFSSARGSPQREQG